MATHCISTRYDLKWELKDAPRYKFTADGKCLNTRTGRRIKRSLVGYTQGYHINGRFHSLKSLRPRLRKIEHIECPF